LSRERYKNPLIYEEGGMKKFLVFAALLCFVLGQTSFAGEIGSQDRYSIPIIGEDAPAFVAKTTQGEINFRRSIKAAGLFSSVILRISHPYVPQSS